MTKFKISTITAIAVYAMLAVVFYSCSQGVSKCENPKNGKAVLVAYRVAKHSHLWLQNPETKQIYDIGSVGGRREPNINLGGHGIRDLCGVHQRLFGPMNDLFRC